MPSLKTFLGQNFVLLENPVFLAKTKVNLRKLEELSSLLILKDPKMWQCKFEDDNDIDIVSVMFSAKDERSMLSK